MFSKILIANRGEIACRVIRTARRMGIATVAVYSEADAGALHVAMADEARLIGPPPARQSYLNIDGGHRRGARQRRRGGASRLRVPVGKRRIRRGLRRRRHRVYRPVAGGDPRDGVEGGGEGADGGARRAGRARLSRRRPGRCASRSPRPSAIGFPVMIKASAGGGGRGMRVVANAAEFARALDGARREAQGAFGDDTRADRTLSRTPRAISRCRCSATLTATSSICSSATARSSAGTRRSSRRRRRRV